MEAMHVMSALAQPTRLAVFRLLVDALPNGLPAGDIASATGTATSNMSVHLAILSRAGIVTSEKIGRTVVYSAATGPVEEASRFLAHECANKGNAEAGGCAKP